MPIRILLADDHKVFRHGLKSAFEQEPDIEVVGEAEDGESALELARGLEPRVVIMDIHMPGMNGTEACRRIRGDHPDIKVLALSMYSDEAYVMGMLEAGASGYLLKNCSFEQLSEGIRAADRGETFLSPDIAGLVVGLAVEQKRRASGSLLDALTPRELEVARRVAEGDTNKRIAAKLFISTATVETHRRQIMRKLKLKSVAELIKLAVREGLTSLDQ